MQVMTLKSMSLQLRLPDAPDGTQRWHPFCTWGFCTADAEAEAYAQLREKQQRKGESWRLIKKYEVEAIIK